MDILNIIKNDEENQKHYKPIDVNKVLEIDTGNLLVCDINEFNFKFEGKRLNEGLKEIDRDNVQALFNSLWECQVEKREEAIVALLPKPLFKLPRARRLPKPRPLTKWEQFAKAKGIPPKKKSKLKKQWDDQLKKWVPLYGYKKVAAEKEKDWVMEVPQNADPYEDQFAKKIEEKSERIAKNELQRLRNIAKAKNVKVPRMGFIPDGATSKDLQAAITVAKASTASLGKFQDKLPHEKEARGIAAITPGAASRKRKAPHVSGVEEKKSNLDIVDGVLNKRPKIDVETAVSRHVRQSGNADGNERKRKAGRRKDGGKKKHDKPSSKKPKGSKGQHKGKGGGRKRR